MKLTKEQITYIDNYIAGCGIKWYDVRMELVDHFATSLEEKLEKNPKLDFKQTVINEHKGFSNNGFKKLLKSKKKAVEKQFYNQVFTHLKSFFKLPKIVISASAFYVLVLFMDLFDNKEYFFFGLTMFAFIAVAQLLVRIFLKKNSNKTQFLILDKTIVFIQLFNFLVILFSSITTFRTENSFNNSTYNYIQLSVFVLLMLFYWCAEFVFSKNKNYVKINYPEIAI